MPYVKKAEFDRLKRVCKEEFGHTVEIACLKEKMNRDRLYFVMTLRDVQWSEARWKRYYQAAIKTFKIQEYVEMPGCFNPMESIEYIAKQQEEQKDEINRHGC